MIPEGAARGILAHWQRRREGSAKCPKFPRFAQEFLSSGIRLGFVVTH
jgi:hypothetical protein